MHTPCPAENGRLGSVDGGGTYACSTGTRRNGSALPGGWVATTDRVFSFATAEGRIADILRTRVAPVLFSKVIAFEAVREYIFRTVSQITLNYRGCPLSAGSAGHVDGGDRLPWVPIDGKDNFESLAAITWQVHVYGSASAELVTWCASHDAMFPCASPSAARAAINRFPVCRAAA
jgi:hypothetical protein